MKYFALIFLTLSLFACKSENEEDLFPPSTVVVPVDTTSGLLVSFKKDIEPLIQNKCATSNCHAANANFPTLLNYTQIEGSKIAINGRVSAGTMPPSGSLAQSDKDLIQIWINEGARNN